MTSFVYSTISADVSYSTYDTGANGLPIVRDSVVIKGGAGVANSNFITPRGVATEVTAEQLALLFKNDCFNRHVKGGWLVVDKKEQNPDKVASTMSSRDGSAPQTPEQLESEGKKVPTTKAK